MLLGGISFFAEIKKGQPLIRLSTSKRGDTRKLIKIEYPI
jgi:hypothetical protein